MSNKSRSILFWKGINKNAVMVLAHHKQEEANARVGIARIQSKYQELKAR